MSDAASAVFGQQRPTDDGTEESTILFHIRQALGQVRTMVPVKVVAVHGGGVGPAGTVDVMPLVKRMDGAGNAFDHSTVFGLPFARLQGGGNAIINDPKIGDTGIVVVSDRDMSAVVAAGGQPSQPGSFREFSLSDGVYWGASLIQGNPNQYVFFTSNGINITDQSGNSIIMDPQGITITDVNGNEITMSAGGVSIESVGPIALQCSVVTVNGVALAVP